MLKYPVLTIAGLDNSGGAGLLADIKTFTTFGCYGMAAETLIAVQNSLGVQERFIIDTSIIKGQIETIFEDIPPKAVKLGMLLNEDIIRMVVGCLKKYAQHIPIVIDPVMMCKGNISLLSPIATKVLVTELLPLATIITPNIPEAMIIIGEDPVTSTLTQYEIAQALQKMDINATIVKGGHYINDQAMDLFIFQNKEIVELVSPRINTPHVHGTGCTLSAAITACLARGFDIKTSVHIAKNFLTKALSSTTILGLGAGRGPVDHLWWVDEGLEHLEL
ncbi:MAG: bifunctional hydroxymethylpyrimidine kinase/phosphomethylpyrimidine kinase [Brevinema sp.]